MAVEEIRGAYQVIRTSKKIPHARKIELLYTLLYERDLLFFDKISGKTNPETKEALPLYNKIKRYVTAHSSPTGEE